MIYVFSFSHNTKALFSRYVNVNAFVVHHLVINHSNILFFLFSQSKGLFMLLCTWIYISNFVLCSNCFLLDKEDETYAQALLVLEQCLAIQQDDNSKGMVLLGMSTLFYERFSFKSFSPMRVLFFLFRASPGSYATMPVSKTARHTIFFRTSMDQAIS